MGYTGLSLFLGVARWKFDGKVVATASGEGRRGEESKERLELEDRQGGK
jgi:hypothetical protein